MYLSFLKVIRSNKMGINYFSATKGSNRTIFVQGEDMWDTAENIDLSLVEAEVFISDRTVGILRTPLFMFDVPELLRFDQAKVRNKVANQSIDRFTGNMPAESANWYGQKD